MDHTVNAMLEIAGIAATSGSWRCLWLIVPIALAGTFGMDLFQGFMRLLRL